MPSHKDTAYDKITKTFVDAIEATLKGDSKTPPWVRPWSTIDAPRNAFSNRAYTGFNAMILGMICGIHGWEDQRFSTYKKIKEMGGQVKKGEKGTPITYWASIEDKKDPTKRFHFLKVWNVFNVMAQSEGVELKTIEAPNKGERDQELDAHIEATNVKLMHGGDRAYYSPMDDHIGMPPFKAFKTSDSYYSTLFHEMTHWTGSKTRLDRDLDQGRFGNEAYSHEELVAELGNAFLCQELGVDGEFQDNHVAYLKSWLKVLQNDPKAIMTASSKAKKATKFVLEAMGHTKEEEAVEEEVTA